MLATKIAVIGQGYVGLPISIAACDAGFLVLGIDTDEIKIQKLANGLSGIEDIEDDKLLKLISAGRFEPSSSYEKISECKIILICVPTPLTSDLQPDLTAVISAVKEISKYFTDDSLIILESTVSPGTTRNFLLPLLEKYSGKSRKDFHVAFSPERIDPRNKQWDLKNTPKLVAGLTSNSGVIAKNFYENFIEKVIAVDSLEVAEIAKLLENSFRLVNISFINEVAVFCNKIGVDINAVIQAAATKPYGFMPFYPSIGVGGHCIPVDPIYLSSKANEIGTPIKSIELAAQVNLDMPKYFIERAEDFLSTLINKKIIVIGVAYKPNISDVRETRVKELITGLRDKGADVFWHDEHVKHWGNSISVELDNSFDLAIIATEHDDLDLSKLGQTPIINCRNSI